MITEGRRTSGFPLETLERLVSLAAGSYDVSPIQSVNDLLVERYEQCGFRVDRVPVADRGDVLVAERLTGRPGSAIGRRVTIVGHSDTVWPLGSVAEPRLSVDAQLSRWVGPGIGDMKAALLFAADAGAAAADQLDDGPAGLIRILVIPDEEVGSVGSAPVIARLAEQTDLCIGLEAGKPDGSFVTSRGAVGVIRIDVRGTAAHVTEPGGVDALQPLLDVLADIRELDLDDVLVSITQVDAGSARQITAASACAWIDLRSDSGSSMAAAVAAIELIVARVQRDSRAAVSMSGGQTRPAFARDVSQQPWSILTDLSAEAVTGVHERGGSDASTFAASGVPTIDGFGPVCFDNCAPGESIAIESVTSRAALLTALITRWSEARP